MFYLAGIIAGLIDATYTRSLIFFTISLFTLISYFTFFILVKILNPLKKSINRKTNNTLRTHIVLSLLLCALTSFSVGSYISEHVNLKYKNYITKISAYNQHHGELPENINQVNDAISALNTENNSAKKSEIRILNTPIHYMKFKENGNAVIYYTTFGFGDKREHFFSSGKPDNDE